MRLERASDSLAKKLEGPGRRTHRDHVRRDGGRSLRGRGVGLARDRARARCRRRRRRVRAAHEVRRAARARARTPTESLGRVVAACEKPYSNVGVALLRLVGCVASAMGDGPRSVRAFVQAAEKDPGRRRDRRAGRRRRHGAIRSRRSSSASRRRSASSAGAEALRVDRREEERAGRPRGRGEHARARAADRARTTRAPTSSASSRTRSSRAGRGEEVVLRDIAAPGVSRRGARRAVAVAREDPRGARRSRGRDRRAAPGRHRRSDGRSLGRRRARRGGVGPRAHPRAGAPEPRRTTSPASAARSASRSVSHAPRARAARSPPPRKRGARSSRPTPRDHEADVAIEALLVARSSYDELAEHLARRAARLAEEGDEKETLRAVRLRRAAILEQRLGRLDEAAAELEQLLRETPAHPSALRWLADLLRAR